jgi:putative oxidoreductase
MDNSTLGNAVGLAARVLLAIIFVMAGIGKLMDPAGTAGYMESMGVPGLLLWPTIILELGGGILIAIGYQTRIVALLLAGFTVLAGLIFHHQFADQNQMIHFMKNLAIAGGFLSLVVNGAGGWSIDGRKSDED